MSVNRYVIVGAILGAFGGWVGFIVGSAIEETWDGVFLGIFLSILAMLIFVTEVPFISIDRLGELIIGALGGLVAEIFIVRSIYIAIVLGAVAGICTASATQNLKPYSAEVKARYFPIIKLILVFLIILIIIASLIWAYPKGIFKDVALVSLVILLPILILVIRSLNWTRS